MKIYLVILGACTVFALGATYASSQSKHGMNVQYVQDNYDMVRFENDEAVCYKTIHALSCFPKQEKK